MSRLPALDPNTRTLLVTGFPNVGKSSFMNKVTRANVDVQPYAFTTKSLYVGHMDYRYLRWQVIDTPGILDHELEKRNAIEMQAVTALAHLPCAILFFVDISEQCGYAIEQQLALFRSIRPLFAGKQLIIVANKVDVLSLDELAASKPDDAAALRALAAEEGVSLLPMSNVTDEGVSAVKTAACDLLLQARVDARLQSTKKIEAVAPPHRRDAPAVSGQAAPEPCIPRRAAARAAKAAAAAAAGGADGEGDAAMADAAGAAPRRRAARRKTQKEPAEGGGSGVYSLDYSNEFTLADASWNHDVMPEIMDGKNVMDFIDADVLAKPRARGRARAGRGRARLSAWPPTPTTGSARRRRGRAAARARAQDHPARARAPARSPARSRQGARAAATRARSMSTSRRSAPARSRGHRRAAASRRSLGRAARTARTTAATR